MHRKDRQIHRHTAFVHRQRWVQNPTNARARLTVTARCQHRRYSQCGPCEEQPKRQVVQTWERHVRCADVQRHEVVPEATKERGDHNEEHHQDAVACDQHIPEVSVGGTFANSRRRQARAFKAHVLHTGIHELEAHVNRECNRDKTGDAGDDQV